MSNDNKYNGWANYGTWAVKLWIDNEESSMNYWRDAARELLADPPESEVLTPAQSALYELEQRVRDEHTEYMPEFPPSVYTDLLGAALDSVDWREIAESILSDSQEY